MFRGKRLISFTYLFHLDVIFTVDLSSSEDLHPVYETSIFKFVIMSFLINNFGKSFQVHKNIHKNIFFKYALKIHVIAMYKDMTKIQTIMICIIIHTSQNDIYKYLT